MKISFNGAAQDVTGSQFLLEANGKRLLIDCGMFQGRREETFTRNQTFAFDPHTLDAVILTHAHVDHSGNLPNLVKQGYSGPIYATSATCDLAALMLQDSGHIQEADADYMNKKRAAQHLPPVQPLYTLEDAKKVAAQFHPVDYNQNFIPVAGVSASLVDAGHILGSSSANLTIQEDGQTQRVWFSGDVGRNHLHILRDPVLPKDVDYLILESTYGDKLHEDPQLAYEEFYQVLQRALTQHGKVIIPAFAVGRTQELVYALNQFISQGRLKSIPVYIDSPLAVNVSDVFRRHPECFDEETRQFILKYHHPALEFDQLTYVRSVEESKQLNHKPGPMIIIAASGMCETGRILHHLKNNIEDERNSILIVSWQAPYTLGRRLADRAEKVMIFGEEYTRRAQVFTIGGLSAHAGQNNLVAYAQATQNTLKGVYLVHGELASAQALQAKMQSVGIHDVHIPRLFESVEI